VIGLILCLCLFRFDSLFMFIYLCPYLPSSTQYTAEAAAAAAAQESGREAKQAAGARIGCLCRATECLRCGPASQSILFALQQNESCLTHTRGMSHRCTSHVSHTHTSHVSHTHESCLTHTQVMSHTCKNDISHMHESCLTHTEVMFHAWYAIVKHC